MSERLDLEALERRHRPVIRVFSESGPRPKNCFNCDVLWPCDSSRLLARVRELEAALRANMAVIGPPPIGPLYYDSAREGAWKLGEDALKR